MVEDKLGDLVLMTHREVNGHHSLVFGKLIWICSLSKEEPNHFSRRWIGGFGSIMKTSPVSIIFILGVDDGLGAESLDEILDSGQITSTAFLEQFLRVRFLQRERERERKRERERERERERGGEGGRERE